MKTLLLSFLCLGFAAVASARPVSYPGGWTLMEQHSDFQTSLHVHYSPSAKHSIGVRAVHLREKDAGFAAVQLNNLLKRWNETDSQANLYLKSGIGLAGEEGTLRPAAFTGLATDWENRRYFVSYANQVITAGSVDNSFTQTGRIGIAPYVGEYGSLHTWLMLQLDHRPGQPDVVELTPLVRFFKGPNLLEIGSSLKGGVMANFIRRF